MCGAPSLQGDLVQDRTELDKKAKSAVRQATEPGRVPREQCYVAKYTAMYNSIERENTAAIPEGVGRYSKGIDSVLLGKHLRKLYDSFKRDEASILAQLRARMA